MNVEQEAQITCPYCSSQFTLLLDISAGDQTLVEDCEVCCRPICFKVHLNLEGQVLDFFVLPPH